MRYSRVVMGINFFFFFNRFLSDRSTVGKKNFLSFRLYKWKNWVGSSQGRKNFFRNKIFRKRNRNSGEGTESQEQDHEFCLGFPSKMLILFLFLKLCSCSWVYVPIPEILFLFLKFCSCSFLDQIGSVPNNIIYF